MREREIWLKLMIEAEELDKRVRGFMTQSVLALLQCHESGDHDNPDGTR